MTFVTVFRRVPKPITGMIGVLYDADFERFEATLDWMVNESVVSRGTYLSRAQLARAVGQGQGWERSVA